jgi:predicted TIM-barrel fold metal-dependent hydrolase
VNPLDSLPAVRAVDCHAHVMRLDAPLVAERHSGPARDVLAEEFVAVLDSHGVSHGVLTAPSFYGADNSILLDALGRYPDRLRGTAIVDPDRPALDELAGHGVVGIRLNWVRRRRRPDPGSSAYCRLFDVVRERKWHIELFLEGERLPDVLPTLRRTGVALVLDHFGCPEPERGVDSAGFRLVLEAVRDGVASVKLSAPYRLRGADPQPYVDALLKAGGPEGLLWGSDWPWVGHEGACTYQECLDLLRTWVPDESARHIILVQTPRRLFRL